jgi:dihydrofolate reductase
VDDERHPLPAGWVGCRSEARAAAAGAVAAAIRRLKESSRSDITIGGAELAGQAIAEGLVDECHLFLGPVLVGGGKRALPAGVHAELELLDERRFRSGVVYLHYRL